MRLPFALACVLVLLAGPAMAQLPDDGSDGIQVRVGQAELETSLDEAGRTTVTVTRTGGATGTPLDQARSVSLRVEGAPEGWVVGVSPATLSLMPGAVGKATLTVGLTAEAVEHADLVVVATMAPSNPAQSETSGTVAVKATRVESLQRDLFEKQGTLILVVTLGLAAALVVAVALLVAQRRVALRLATDTSVLQVKPGRRATTPVRVANLLAAPDSAYLSVFGVPDGWVAHLDQGVVGLEGREQRETHLTVTAPRDWDGTESSVFVKGVSGRYPRKPATFEIKLQTPKHDE